MPKLLAGCVIYDNKKRILLIHRNKPDLKWWELPGGKVDKYELPSETAVREIREEIGVDVDIIQGLGHTFFTYYDIDWQYFWFEAKVRQNQYPQIAEPENFDDLRYFSLAEIADLKVDDLSPNVQNLLKVLQ